MKLNAKKQGSAIAKDATSSSSEMENKTYSTDRYLYLGAKSRFTSKQKANKDTKKAVAL